MDTYRQLAAQLTSPAPFASPSFKPVRARNSRPKGGRARRVRQSRRPPSASGSVSSGKSRPRHRPRQRSVRTLTHPPPVSPESAPEPMPVLEDEPVADASDDYMSDLERDLLREADDAKDMVADDDNPDPVAMNRADDPPPLGPPPNMGLRHAPQGDGPVLAVGEPAMGDEDGRVYTYLKFDGMDVSENGPAEEKSDQPNWCFQCHVRGSHEQFVGNTFLHDLESIRRENYGLVSMDALTSMMQDFYNENLRPFIEPESDRRPWSRRVIAQHIEEHAPDSYTDCMRSMRIMRGVLRVLGGRLCMSNVADASDQVLNTGHTKLYMSMLVAMGKLTSQADRLQTSSALAGQGGQGY
ncbi:MAG: hypothetical protein JKY23_05365 [Nitrospinaceae bacterium]|nr:hypothetical protein [Nitrospinaceae bacterium]